MAYDILPNLLIDLDMRQWLAGNMGGALAMLMSHCKAWAPYWGSSIGLGAGGKLALRYIQTVHMTDNGSEVAIL